MTARTRTALLASALLAAAPWATAPWTPARAADVTADQAAAAEAAVRDWMSGMLGPQVKLPERPVHLTPAGDHFDVSEPIVMPGASGAPLGTLMAQARPLEGGKWAIDGIHTTMPLSFTVNVPVPPATGGKADPKAKPERVPVHYTVDIKGQDGHGVIDTLLNGPTTWTTTATSATIQAEGGPFPSVTKTGPATSVVTLQPSGAGLVDVSSAADIQNYHMTSGDPAAEPTTVDMATAHVSLAVAGLSRARAQSLTQAVASLAAAGTGPHPGGTAPKAGPELVAALLDALHDAASSVSLEERADTLAVTAAGVPVTIGRVSLALAGKSVDGLLEAQMPLELQGLSTTALPPDFAALIPSTFMLKPTISGVGVAELSRIATAANEKRDPAPDDMQALFSHGGVRFGVESMTLALAGATFEGQGAVLFTTPQDYNGTARVTATGYDDLMAKVGAIQAFSAQSIPALAFVKGIAKTEGGKLVWDITYARGKVLVNNVDILALAGAGAPKAAAPPAVSPSTPTPVPGSRPAPGNRTPGRPSTR